MARYNREFLVQYLRDIYALYIAEEKILQKCNSIDREWRIKKNNPPRPQYPAKPVREPYPVATEGSVWLNFFHMMWVGLTVFAMVLGAFVYIMTVVVDGEETKLLTIFVVIILGMIIIDQPARIKIRREDKKDQKEIKRINDKYAADMEEYAMCCKEIDTKIKIDENEHANELALLSRSSTYCWQEWKRVCALREKVYSANIVPRQYRDKYAAVYLYDYFESSGENDLGMALNTYVLEQIKERLDRIMDQLSEVILNQYTMMQNQERAMEQADRHHDEMMQRLNRIEADGEERNKYLKMIESNTETLKYFATADYLWRW